MLEVERIHVSYGAAAAIVDVSLSIGERELVCVVGPNGAGKTTLINALAGLHRIDSGALRLDEPSLGLAPLIVNALFETIRTIAASGVTMLLVEQNVALALDVASRAYVLEEGRIAAQGAPAELRRRPEIRRAYLGLTEEAR